MKSFSIKESLSFGWETFKKNPWTLIGVTLTVMVVPQVIQTVFGVPVSGFSGTDNRELTPVMTIGILISIIVSLFLAVGLLKIYLKLADGKKVIYSELFQVNAEEVVRYLIGSILYSLIVFFGMILLIIPAIYWGIKYQYYSYLIIEKKLGPIEALKESGKITTGKIRDLFVLNVVFILVSLLGVLALFIGIFIASPVVAVATTYVYRKLAAKKS